MNTEIDSLVNAFENKTTIEFKPKHTFIQDINIIIQELINYHTLIGIDIYEVLVSCGHNITWNQDYYISHEDLNWFKNDGKIYFLNAINSGKSIDNIIEYNTIIDIHLKLISLFELQLE
jgi:hypothetical protein